MNIHVSTQPNVAVIEVAGRIDSNNANQFGDALSGVISQGQNQLVLDLAGVDYMSSAGLREIVAAAKKLQDKGELRLAQPSERVREVLEMTGLDSVFQIFPSQAEAVSSF
ncbi:MAG: STAS domain-containing protein [Anaerolineae bacterium]|nr:STAS domain-containing protein [Anaerolineae bacterium]